VTKQDLQRFAKGRLTIRRHCEEVTHNVSKIRISPGPLGATR
jgi:hypothetical protein